MSTYSLACDGAVSVLGDGAPVCSTAWKLVQVAEQFDPSTLDPAALVQAFGVGFGSVATVLAAIFGVRAILKMLRS